MSAKRPKELYVFPKALEEFSTPDPIDPNMTNRRRAGFAAKGLSAFGRAVGVVSPSGEVGDDLKTIVQDLLTDLMHFCSGHGIDWADVLEDARGMYEQEVYAARSVIRHKQSATKPR